MLIFRRITKFWRRMQRRTDMNVLWPMFVEKTPKDLTLAKMGFAIHAFSDPAWTRDFTHDEIKTFINELTPDTRGGPREGDN